MEARSAKILVMDDRPVQLRYGPLDGARGTRKIGTPVLLGEGSN